MCGCPDQWDPRTDSGSGSSVKVAVAGGDDLVGIAAVGATGRELLQPLEAGAGLSREYLEQRQLARWCHLKDGPRALLDAIEIAVRSLDDGVRRLPVRATRAGTKEPDQLLEANG